MDHHVEIETIEPAKQASMDSGEYSGSSNSVPYLNQMDPTNSSPPYGNSFARKRNHVNGDSRRNEASEAEAELARLRKLVAEAEKERRTLGCTRGTIEPTFMSTVFGVVLLSIIGISVYAFTSLYKALMKRFFKDQI